MNHIKKGDIVGRISYKKDILFKVKYIIEKKGKKIVVLSGIIQRIEADSEIEDLEIIKKAEVEKRIIEFEKKVNENLIQGKRSIEIKIKGKIMHLDGDRKYSEKSYKYYKKLGLNAIVRNIPEYKQPLMIKELLSIYRPDILVVTGHDSMLRKNRGYNDINNYRNSRYFIETVKRARMYFQNNKLSIFAGACQSYYEGLILAGANFASSPGRILIDFTDPLIVAEEIASTEREKFININDIEAKLKDGKKGVNGVGTFGKMIKNIKM